MCAAFACGTEQPPRSSGDGSGGITLDGGSVDGSGTADSGTGNDTAGCGQAGNIDFSYIWIANSTEGTVSKIDTQTAVELGRYRTGADALTDPSRTSVNLDGDVVVVNRHGGAVKIGAIEERCVDRDGNGIIDTSTGPADIKPWGEDECVLWSVELPFFPDDEGGNRWGPRPVAWDGGTPDPDDSCRRTDARVWVGWYTGIDTNTGEFRRLDGATGTTLDTVVVPDWAQIPLPQVRPYGGATDVSGNFWVLGKNNQLVRIDGTTLDYEQHYAPQWVDFYGLALDQEGEPWIGGCDGDVYHFDGDSFESVGGIMGCARGLAVDDQGRAWIAGNDPCRLSLVDTETTTLLDDAIALPGCIEPVGVSIDVQGYVWVVDNPANMAFKVDPDTHAVVATVGGLVGPYTYSDMTGAGLRLVFTPEG
ncbi:MAG: hypothetical protein K1X88_04965 [Nannocystaceae bacterium]|nr:hypothetical protein [Nannocystaceae bacterium]